MSVTNQRYLFRGLLALGLLAFVLPVPTSAQDMEVDPWAPARKACVDLRFEAEYEKAFDCMVDLWSDHRTEMSRDGQIELLQNMAEMYIVYAGNASEARRCYEHILSLDPHWLPDQFDHWPTSYREPVIAAYHERGYLMRSPELRNVALLDFEVIDMAGGDVDLGRIGQALPDYISGYLQRTLEDARLKGDDVQLRVLNTRERHQVFDDANRANLQLGDAQTAAVAGRQLAVQAFLDGVVARPGDGRVYVTLRLTSVETAEVIGSVTAEGKEEKVFPVLQDALRKWVKSMVEGAELGEDDGAAELGPMAQRVVALERYHDALRLAEEERFGEAIDLTLQALELRPDAAGMRQFLVHLQEQQDYADLALRTDDLVPLRNLDLQ